MCGTHDGGSSVLQVLNPDAVVELIDLTVQTRATVDMQHACLSASWTQNAAS